MFVLLVLTLSMAINTNMAGAQSDTFNTTCSPFRLHVIWHTSNGEDAAFIEQKRLIIQLLLNIPQGTEIHVTALDTRRYNLLHFKKNETTDWIFNISMYYPKILENHTIKGSLINESVVSFRKQNDKKEVAELTVLVVSEKTLTDNSLEMIKNIKICVVFTGLNPPPPFWTSLTTDRQHVVMLNTTSESISANINGVADTVLDLLCRDSRLICDYDEFWARNRCVSCSDICSADTKNLQDVCLALCPYYRQLSLENAENEADKNVTGESDKTNNDRMLLSLLLLSPVSATLTVVAVCVYCRRVRMLKQHSTAYLKRKYLNQETSQTHDEIELRAQQETIHLKSSEGI